MEPPKFVLDILELFKRAYFLILQKPYATVKIEYMPQRDTSDKITEELITLTIINECFGEIDIQGFWFLTTFNRQVFSESVNSKIPVKVPENDRATYYIPIKELKNTLNKSVGETITKAVVFDQNEYSHIGRVAKEIQEIFAK